MDFTHYSSGPVDLAVALVNTDQRPVGEEDGVSDLVSLKEFLAGFEELWGGVARSPKSQELGEIHHLRDVLREVMSSGDEEGAAELINGLLVANGGTPRVSLHDGDPHLHFEPQNPTMTSWLSVTTAMGLATVLVEHGLDRFGTCQSSTCQDVFVDTSRNRSRRHCSTQCSTREAVIAHRRRQEDR